MVDQKKLEWIWDNINLIYLNIGRNYGVEYEYKDIKILSNDNYFKCVIDTRRQGPHYDYLVFTIEKEYSFINPPNYYLFSTNFDSLDDIIKVLKPVFRDFKIEMISK